MGSPAKSPLAPAESNRGDTPTTSEAAKVAMGGESPVGAVQCEELRGLSVAEQAWRLPKPVVRPVFEPGDARESCFGRTTKNLILYDKEAACASTAGLGTVYKTAAIQPKPMLELKAPPVVFTRGDKRLLRGGKMITARFFGVFEGGEAVSKQGKAKRRRAKPPASESAAKNWKKELVPAPSWTHVRDKLKAEEVRAACAAWDVPTNVSLPEMKRLLFEAIGGQKKIQPTGLAPKGPAAGSPGRQDRGGDGRGSGADGGYGRDRSSYGRDRSSYDGDGDRRGGDGRGSGADGGYGRDDRGIATAAGHSRCPVPRGRDRNDDDRGSYGPPPHSRDSCGYDQGAMIVRGAA
ncbi:hypothetical protein JL721_12753 [Aureococcus anophagefferens]|nr:hypothetical protein JL721_12753 [Aureococcus anophagefferens]